MKVRCNNKKGRVFISHYDYVLCPDGKKRKISSVEDIEQLLAEWSDYCDTNWINGGQQMFDPESKIKFMLDGIGNILLRNHYDGVLTEYKKMKIGKYEIPISSCASMLGDEYYAERPVVDNGEGVAKMERILDDAARKFDEAQAVKNSKQRREKLAKKPVKKYPPTRRQRIEKARKQYGVTNFEWVRVDVDNIFFWDGKYYHISDETSSYAPRILKDGDKLYDMDQILCGRTAAGESVFFDMNIVRLTGVECVGEQTSFL